jgi:hypothetical protein
LGLKKHRRLTEEVIAAYHEEAPAIWMHEVVMFTGLGPKMKAYREDNTAVAYNEIEL